MNAAAVVNYAPKEHSVELRSVEVPKVGNDDVLLKVASVGVCGSDLHQWMGDHNWQVNYPVILGHEFSGTVYQVGKNAVNWKEGDRVVSETAAVIDHNNPITRQGLYQLDPSRKGFGYGVDGAMTEFVRVPARCLHHVPDNLSLEKAALTEPCCVAYNATVINARIKPGDRVVVFGPGTIGLLCAAMARLSGAQVGIVGLKQDRKRLTIAESYGCKIIIDGINGIDEIDDLNAWAFEEDGLGVDGVIDAAGVSATLKKAVEIVRPAGWITKVGWGPEPLGFSLDPLVQKNVKLQGSFSHNWGIWERVLRLLSRGILNVDPIIGGTWRLEDWKQAFESMQNGKILKALLKPA